MDTEDCQEKLVKLCAEAFGSDTKASALFLLRRHPELQNRAPGCVAQTYSGCKEVEEIIQKGLHGLPT